MLFEARAKGYHFVRQESLLRAACSLQPRLRELFRDHPAWARLIVGVEDGSRAGQYRLAA
jgi:hypothetical protein